jgi:hypothetical protein
MVLVSCGSSKLTVSNAWARTGITGGNSAIYLVMDNPTNQDDILLYANSNVAEAVELHISQMTEEGIMTMQQQEKIPLPSGTKVEFKPGGLHIMLVNLKQDLIAGDSFQVTFTFQNAGEINLEVQIQAP